MPETSYNYSIAADTANAALDVASLDYELRRADPPLAKALLWVSQNVDDLELRFEDALDAGDQTALDALVLAHTGVALPSSVVIQTAHITNADTVSSTQWADVGGVVTRPEIFGPLPELSARVICAVLVPAQGLDLRLCERDEDQTERELETWTEADSVGIWRFLELDAGGATPGTHEYVVQAKLVSGGSNAEIRSAMLSLIRTEGA